VLEESTDSDVTIFSSEEDEDGNEPYSDEDGKLDVNSETKWHRICFKKFFSASQIL
jgi:hypothetical protein